MRCMKSQKSSSYFFRVFVVEKQNFLFYCNYYERDQTVKKWKKKLNQKKYLYFYDILYECRQKHVNWYRPPIYQGLGIEQQEVSCVNIHEFGRWSRQIYIQVHIQKRERERERHPNAIGEEHDFFRVLCSISLVTFFMTLELITVDALILSEDKCLYAC